MTIIGLVVRGGIVTVAMGCEYRSECNNQGNCMNGECYCVFGAPVRSDTSVVL